MQAGNRFLDFQGTPAGPVTVTAPDSPTEWIARNTSGQIVTVKNAAGTGVAVQSGSNAHLYSDGAGVYALPPAGATTFDQDILAENPRLYYRCGETAGTALADSSGNSLNLSLSGGFALQAGAVLANDPIDQSINRSIDQSINFDGATGKAEGIVSLT